MANITTYLQNKLLEHSLGKTDYDKPTVYAGLFVNSPTVDGDDGNEVVGSGYERISLTDAWGSATNGTIANTEPLVWEAQGYWGVSESPTSSSPITAIGLFDADVNGNVLWYGPLSSAISMANGDSFTIPSGNLIISLL